MLNIIENVALAPYTVFKIGGNSDYFCEVKNKEELIEALAWANKKQLAYFILGAGSNVLFPDEGFRGLVIKMNLQGLSKKSDFHHNDGSPTSIIVEAGVSMARAVSFAIEHGIGRGFEWGVGVPGTIGGSIYGNAGCYGGEMEDVVESVEALNASSPHAFQDMPRADCQFSYRHSIFKEHPEWIILGSTLKLNASDPNQSRAKVIEYTKKRTTSQDIGSKCAGCIFKNYIPKDGGQAMSAGLLIDKAGLKGRVIGGAMVSGKHANFIVNNGTATARDIVDLIGVIKDEVQKVHGVLLEEEIKII